MNAIKNSVAVATTSELAASAAEEIAALGGNAVDCGIAASMCSINTQPGVCALAGSAFVTVWRDGDEPVTIDGNVAVPGIGRQDKIAPRAEAVQLAYGGGIETVVGAASVAVPGLLAALHLASRHYGSIPWHVLMAPSIRAAREGFPLAAACHYFLGYAGDSIYGRSADGHGALHDREGKLLPRKSTIVVPHLADSLQAIADEGERVFYSGDIGRRIVEHIQDQGGLLTAEDLSTYRAEVRPCLTTQVGNWTLATNPPPAIGGASLVAMLLTFGTQAFKEWTNDRMLRLIKTQEAIMRYRYQHLDRAEDVGDPLAALLRSAGGNDMISRYASAATVHTSAVDTARLACSITASSGYGSGEMAPRTGIWLNNCLGELELNRFGLDAGPPGKRLPSNMAPSAARSGDALLAMGTPGADRITTASHQFILNFMQRGLDLHDAVAHPRLHLKIDDQTAVVAVEPGFDIPDSGYELSRYEEISMYFGGVAAALVDAKSNLQAAADPRREGGTFAAPWNANGRQAID